MTPLAAMLGRFFGAMLAECAPVLVEIITHAVQNAFADTVEDGARRDALRERLLERLRPPSRIDPARGTGTPAGANQEGQGVGGGQGRD
jgi:hypothetical protein